MIKVNEAKLTDQAYERARSNRSSAFKAEADPLFFKVQRGEAPLQEWKDKIEEIRQRYPYPDSITQPKE